MAQGCINIADKAALNNKDKRDKVEKDEKKKSRDNANLSLSKFIDKTNEELIKDLSSTASKKYKIVERNLKIALDAEGLNKIDSEKLMQSLKILSKNHSKHTGLFNKSGRKYESTMSHGYELIGTSAIISKGDTGMSNSLGKPLLINKTDSIDFGRKHRGAPLLRKNGSGTVESDLLIGSNNGKNMVGVDFKYSKSGKTRNLSKSNDFIRQLESLEDAMLLTNIKEYHFVSNAKFSIETKERITQSNIKLIESSLKIRDANTGKNSYHNAINKVLNEGSVSLKECASNKNVMKKIYEVNSRFGVPQIGVSEEVNLNK